VAAVRNTGGPTPGEQQQQQQQQCGVEYLVVSGARQKNWQCAHHVRLCQDVKQGGAGMMQYGSVRIMSGYAKM
jgi:hypothetical protein